MPDAERKTDIELWKEFEEARPEILGALLTGLSVGLRRLPTIKTILPRMASFAQFATACETAFWPRGTFAAAHELNAVNAVAKALDANIAVSTFRDFMEVPDGKWIGTATQLFTVLTERIRKPEHDAVEAQEGGRRQGRRSADPDGSEGTGGAAGRARRYKFWLASSASHSPSGFFIVAFPSVLFPVIGRSINMVLGCVSNICINYIH